MSEKKGYIIFNADGTQPKTTLAVLTNDGNAQTIINGSGGDMILSFGYIVQGLVEAGVDKELLKGSFDMALETGKMWGSLMHLMQDTARSKARDLGFDPDNFTEEDAEEAAARLAEQLFGGESEEE